MIYLMGVKKYRHGYIGFAETDDSYRYFQFSRGKLSCLQTYPKKDYESIEHFISVIRKFVHASFFFKEPVAIDAITEETLQQVSSERRTP